MSMNITKSFLVFLFLVTSVTLAAGKTTLPDGGVESPYESCKSVVIVSKDSNCSYLIRNIPAVC